jgi:2'-phosphotransferase
MSRKPLTKDVQISKTLSYLLRHGAVKEGLYITQGKKIKIFFFLLLLFKHTFQIDGYAKIEDILKYKTFKGRFSQEDIINVVQNCPKQRYALKYEDLDDQTASAHNKQLILIRANQGHSLENVELSLEEVTDPNLLPNCIHGTYLKCWDSIKKQVKVDLKQYNLFNKLSQ